MNIKNILLIGRTGSGKSTLANVLINQNGNFEEVFKESAGSISETKQAQIKEFTVNVAEDGSEQVRYLVIDTAGFGDTKLTDKEVLELMSELVKIIGNDGLIQIFFVTKDRFTEEEIDTYQLLESVIFDDKVSQYTTIIKTKFPEFENEVKCGEERKKFRAESQKLTKIFNTSKIIFVNNPPLVGRSADINKEIREESRKRLLTYLGTCQSVYQSGNLATLNQRIKDYKTAKEKLENQISGLRSQISQAESNYWSQIQALERKNREEVEKLEQRKQDELNQIRENSRYGWINNKRPYWTIEYSWNKDAQDLKYRDVKKDEWSVLTDSFHFKLKNLLLSYRNYSEAQGRFYRILYELGRDSYLWVSNSKFYSESGRYSGKSVIWNGKPISYRDGYNCAADGHKLENFLNKILTKDDYESSLYINVYSDYPLPCRYPSETVKIGIKEHSGNEYVDLERALAERNAISEQEIVSQIERIKQENHDRENRLRQEADDRRLLNEQKISQDRQNIQDNLDSIRQASQARITCVKEQINNTERSLEQQFSGIAAASLARILKIFIG